MRHSLDFRTIFTVLTLTFGASAGLSDGAVAQEQSTSAPETSSTTTQSTASKVDERAKALLEDKRPPSSLSQKELRRRIKTARALLRDQSLSSDLRAQIRSFIADSRRQLNSGASSGKTPEAASSDAAIKAAAKQPSARSAEKPMTAAESEQAAQKLLTNQKQPSEMTVGELRGQLKAIRRLTASKQLAPDTLQKVTALRQSTAAALKKLRQTQTSGGADASDEPESGE